MRETRSYHPLENRSFSERAVQSTIYRKIAEGTFPAQLKIPAPAGLAGMNPKSTTGSSIPPHGVRNTTSMQGTA